MRLFIDKILEFSDSKLLRKLIKKTRGVYHGCLWRLSPANDRLNQLRNRLEKSEKIHINISHIRLQTDQFSTFQVDN